MDGKQKFHAEKLKLKHFSKSLRALTKKFTITQNSNQQQGGNMIELINILKKDCSLRSKEDINFVAQEIKKTSFFNFYEKEFQDIPSALRLIASEITFEQFHPCQKIYQEKERAKKVYIILKGEVSILSQYLKADRFKNFEEPNQNMINGDNENQMLNFGPGQEFEINPNDDPEKVYEKMFSLHFSQVKQFQLLKEFDFFGDTDVRHQSKYSFCAVAKGNVQCAVIPSDIFMNYLGENVIF